MAVPATEDGKALSGLASGCHHRKTCAHVIMCAFRLSYNAYLKQSDCSPYFTMSLYHEPDQARYKRSDYRWPQASDWTLPLGGSDGVMHVKVSDQPTTG